ncbi:MAG: YggS family pyridoxal phosphate-dependent enzyme [Anaerovoracaceae bacterium]|jgi:pyridoxal phosphate enzyme (YggS family)
MNIIGEKYRKAEESKEKAAEAVGRKADDVLIIAVSKTKTADEINQAIDAGVTDIGENKVQEIVDKFDKVKPVRWHMIGHLQTNKVKYIIDKVDLIHSVDSLRLAMEINRRAEQHNKVMEILIQINAAQEESKFGVSVEDVDGLLNDILDNCPNIRVCGFMCIAPYEEDPNDVAVYFHKVKYLYEKYKKTIHPGADFKYLSMGMSHDYKVAIAEGSNMIRIGTAIFGERNYNRL